ncbi:hypothetical protein AcetOrient_orf03273 [Acetobacter orientalis]|uniref:Uncharacterized protein n=1 Tax=Acetobacter orientalis TaxID=146474 RepID=A0A2Z5ZIW8_9PROT|nr:hypothetical protein AcetOrient_orf03273 [Acetobacter orientalis]
MVLDVNRPQQPRHRAYFGQVVAAFLSIVAAFCQLKVRTAPFISVQRWHVFCAQTKG